MASEYLHFAKSTIYKWVEENYIPHKKLGKRVLFIKNDIDQWVLNNGMMVEDLPEVPKFTTIRKGLPYENRNSTRYLNQQPNEPNLKYRKTG